MAMSMKNLRILVADDHALMRRGIKALLETHPGWQVCGEAETGCESIERAAEWKPDVAIVDIWMPDVNGIEAARGIREVAPETEIIIYSVSFTDGLVREIIAAGVKGYIVKSDCDRVLAAAVERVANHKTFYTSNATKMTCVKTVNPAIMSTPSPEVVYDRLTSRERKVAQLIAEGKSSKQVATMLGISVKTADTHRSNIMRKLELHSAGELIRYAIRNRMIEP
jgi:DNA-binding NarL/FixJ family response regulator